MKYQITPPSSINGSVTLPASKSISNRVLILNALAKNAQLIDNISDSDDTNALREALANTAGTVNIGAAGTAMRFLTTYLAITPGSRVLTGSERMKKRPIKILVEALRQLGASINYVGEDGFPPLLIDGKVLDGGEITINGNISSQYISALLMIAPTLKNGLSVKITGELISTPYVALTLQLMETFGVKSSWEGNHIDIPHQPYTATPYLVEGDWSAASYWYEMAALCPGAEIRLKGLFRNSLQGDSKVVDIFDELGVSTLFSENEVTLTNTEKKRERFVYNFINEPDLAQAVAVTCALLKTPFHFEGVQSLKIKETDRIEALRAELGKLGYRLEKSDGATLTWNGVYSEPCEEAVIHTYDDHRMAMAFAPACLKTEAVTIDDPLVNTKSYPAFWNDLQTAGFMVKKLDKKG